MVSNEGFESQPCPCIDETEPEGINAGMFQKIILQLSEYTLSLSNSRILYHVFLKQVQECSE